MADVEFLCGVSKDRVDAIKEMISMDYDLI